METNPAELEHGSLLSHDLRPKRYIAAACNVHDDRVYKWLETTLSHKMGPLTTIFVDLSLVIPIYNHGFS